MCSNSGMRASECLSLPLPMPFLQHLDPKEAKRKVQWVKEYLPSTYKNVTYE